MKLTQITQKNDCFFQIEMHCNLLEVFFHGDLKSH